ncbi:MAG: tetratricopeptide repeat protein [Phycisphaerales bacterium]
MSQTGLVSSLRDALSLKNLVPGVLSNAAWTFLQKLGEGLSVSEAGSYLHQIGFDPPTIIAVGAAASIFGVGYAAGRNKMEAWAERIKDSPSGKSAEEYLESPDNDASSTDEIQVSADAVSAEAEKRFCNWLVDLPEELRNLQILSVDTNETVHKLDAKVDSQGETLAKILEAVQRPGSSEKQIEEKVRQELQREYGEKLQQALDAKDAAERAAQAVMDVRDQPDIVEQLRSKGGAAIVDALLKQVAAPQAEVLKKHRQIAEWAYLVGDITQAEKSLDIILAAEPDDLFAVNLLGLVLKLRGDLSGAEKQYRHLLGSDNAADQSAAIANLGLIERRRGNWDAAERMHRQSLAIEKTLDRMEGQANQLGNLGLVELDRENFDSAWNLFRQSYDIDWILGRLEGQATALINLSKTEIARNNLNMAEQFARKGMAIEQKLGCLAGQAKLLSNLVVHAN